MDPDDFPAMWTRPPLADVLACLDTLRAPGDTDDGDTDGDGDGDDGEVWDHATPAEAIEAHTVHAQRHAAAIARYLGSIVQSDLAWLADDDAREQVWSLASRRLAARCGRTAMGAITRRWPLPTPGATTSLVLREPALVGDSLGLKTWGTSYAMAQMLPALLASAHLQHLASPVSDDKAPVLELGAGTGLLGLAAAVLWRANVVLTDLAAIVPNLAHNVGRNAAAVAAAGGQARAGVLEWGALRAEHDPDAGVDVVDPVLVPADHLFPLVVVADPIYDDEHPGLLAHAVDANLCMADNPYRVAPRAVVMVPLRDANTERMAHAFVAAMAARGLIAAHTGTMAGQDTDWAGTGNGAGSDFTCAWWVFRR